MYLHQIMIECIKKINKKSVKDFVRVVKKRNKTMEDWEKIDGVYAMSMIFNLVFWGFMFFLATFLFIFGVVGEKGFTIIIMCSFIPMFVTILGFIIDVFYSNPYD